MDYSGLPERLALVRARIGESQRRGGWSHPVRIVAVTKGHGPPAVRAAVEACLTDIGENRVQEAMVKQDAVGALPVAWHLIGSLQRNKARLAVQRFAWIHSVDRGDLAVELDRRVAPGLRQRVLIEVNCSGEPQKAGVTPDQVLGLAEQVASLPRLDLQGLMTMAAFTDDAGIQHRTFGLLRSLRDRLHQVGVAAPELSMGMSADYPVAVEEGATMVRLGTILFGERPT